MGDLHISADELPNFTDKIVIITGGSFGIGAAIVDQLLDRGAIIVNGDVHPPPGTAHTDSKNYEYQETDIASWNSQLALFKHVMKNHGRIDIVFANAGIDESEHAFVMTEAEKNGDPVQPQWSTAKVNIIGTLNTAKLALHYLRKQEGGGHIIFTASRAAYENFAMPVYTASKHATLGLIRCLKHHTPGWNIQVNLIAPGVTKTSMTDTAMQRFEELGMYTQTPTEVALAAVYLASHSEWNGKAISISAGKYRELEGIYDSLKPELYGADDWKPETKDELEATLNVLSCRW
ncbi:putative short-chain dehydrogenase [Dactylonectria macrodidyma]|uniref:Short-chain dehydrogenase n=1 Tax=Dactylonectria macrodidyma TaxID=307937 RepID=A0A9P9DYD6_9HYPO|nr:putative short-chain dehydrogenase [Dactylonectria macrodidyma]